MTMKVFDRSVLASAIAWGLWSAVFFALTWFMIQPSAIRILGFGVGAVCLLFAIRYVYDYLEANGWRLWS